MKNETIILRRIRNKIAKKIGDVYGESFISLERRANNFLNEMIISKEISAFVVAHTSDETFLILFKFEQMDGGWECVEIGQ